MMSKLHHLFFFVESNQTTAPRNDIIDVGNQLFWIEGGLAWFDGNRFLQLFEVQRPLRYYNPAKNFLCHLDLSLTAFANTGKCTLERFRQIFGKVCDDLTNILLADLFADIA